VATPRRLVRRLDLVMRRIRLIPEYGAHPIWEWVEDGTEDVDPAELPVSPDLRLR
jgi:hypothetical protein